MRKDLRPADSLQIKETVEDELWDILHYVTALANCYDVDLEQVIRLKEAVSNEKYQTGVTFDPR